MGDGLDGTRRALVGGSAVLAASLAGHTVFVRILVEAYDALADSPDHGPVGRAGEAGGLFVWQVEQAGLAEGIRCVTATVNAHALELDVAGNASASENPH